jgi:hypothetical protein
MYNILEIVTMLITYPPASLTLQIESKKKSRKNQEKIKKKSRKNQEKIIAKSGSEPLLGLQ